MKHCIIVIIIVLIIIFLSNPIIQLYDTTSIVGMSFPINRGEKTLEANFAEVISEGKEIRVFGGFTLRTKDSNITGDSAIINIETNNVRNIKGLKIYKIK